MLSARASQSALLGFATLAVFCVAALPLSAQPASPQGEIGRFLEQADAIQPRAATPGAENDLNRQIDHLEQAIRRPSAAPAPAAPRPVAAPVAPAPQPAPAVAGDATLTAVVAGVIAQNPDIVLNVIRANPQIVLQALQRLPSGGGPVAAAQPQPQPQGPAEPTIEQVKALLPAMLSDEGSLVYGNPEGSITLVKYNDYRCGFCKRMNEPVKAAIEAFPDLRVVVREFPILGPASRIAAQATLAAKLQDPALANQLADELIAFQGPLDETILGSMLPTIAQRIGLDPDRLAADMPQQDAVIQQTYAIAQQLSIRGTPTFILSDGRMIRGAIPQETLFVAIEQLSRQAAAN